jgi:glycosyltransferase involved in cell wall biosynthesis
MESSSDQSIRIAVLVPCFNEELSIAGVVADFRRELPNAIIYVYDNNSIDRTCEVARAAGAVVRVERRQGKGHVVRRMFADIDADIYVLVDGDGTYDAASASRLIEQLLRDGLDLLNVSRQEQSKKAYRPGHRFGNRLLTGLVTRIFGSMLTDMLSGYKILSRRFVKSFPALSGGFEIETEITVHALELRMPIAEIPAPYFDRPTGSASKLNTFRDGARILKSIGILVKEERPLAFFSICFIVLAVLALLLGWPLIATFLETGLVPRLPTAVLSTGLIILAFLSLACGLILDTVTRGRRELRRLHYLQLPSIHESQRNGARR